MDADVFLDTNILLRLLNQGLPDHELIKTAVGRVRSRGGRLWINRQVIREYLVQVTRPGFLAQPLSPAVAASHVRLFGRLFAIADETQSTTERLIDLLQQYPSGGKQIHDANIVASMLVHQIGTLITFNLDDMRRFSPVVQVIAPAQVP